MTKETAKAVKKEGYNKVGLLTSESTYKMGFYQKEFNELNIETFSVTPEQQKTLNQVILNVMSGGQGEIDKESIKSIISTLREQGVESIVLGCTELPLAFTQKDTDIKLFSSTEIIARAALEYAFEGKYSDQGGRIR